ncbi:MAG: MarC family protein [Candidatus Micrarchaeota archaeon]
MLEPFLVAFASLFVIMNPFSSLIPFLLLTKDHTAEERARSANLAALVAGTLAVAFLFTGPVILQLMGLSLSSFKIAGGIVLTLLGLQTVLGLKLANGEDSDKEAVAVLIGTPLLTGPGVLTSVIIMSQDLGGLATFLAILASVAASWLILRAAGRLSRLLGKQMLLVIVKIMGLLLVTRGVQFVVQGVLKP